MFALEKGMLALESGVFAGVLRRRCHLGAPLHLLHRHRVRAHHCTAWSLWE